MSALQWKSSSFLVFWKNGNRVALKITPTVTQSYCEVLFWVVELDAAQFTAMAQARGEWGTANLMHLFYVKMSLCKENGKIPLCLSRKVSKLYCTSWKSAPSKPLKYLSSKNNGPFCNRYQDHEMMTFPGTVIDMYLTYNVSILPGTVHAVNVISWAEFCGIISRIKYHLISAWIKGRMVLNVKSYTPVSSTRSTSVGIWSTLWLILYFPLQET